MTAMENEVDVARVPGVGVGSDHVPEGGALKEQIARLSSASVAARLRGVMPEIDRQVRDGVRYAEILAVLSANGLTVKHDTLRIYLYRYRKKLTGSGQGSARERAGASVAPLRLAAASRADDKAKDALRIEAASAASALDDVLERARRNAIGDEYLGRQRPMTRRGRQSEKDD